MSATKPSGFGGTDFVRYLRLKSVEIGLVGCAHTRIGNIEKQQTGRWLNNRAENSHLPIRRREKAILRFRQNHCLQKFASVHSFVHNHFDQERHLYSRANFKLNRTAALVQWRQLFSA